MSDENLPKLTKTLLNLLEKQGGGGKTIASLAKFASDKTLEAIGNLNQEEKKQINKSLKELSAGASRKALLESIARVTEDIGIDKRAGIIEQEIAQKFKEGKMEKPPKDTKNPGKGGKGNITLERETITIGDKLFMKNKDGEFEEIMKNKDGGSVISMKEGGVPTEYKGFSMLPEAVQQKMDPELAKKYKKGGSVNKKTGIKRRITIKGMGIAKRGF